MHFLHKNFYIYFLAVIFLFISTGKTVFIDDKSHLNRIFVNQIIKVPSENYLVFLKSVLNKARLDHNPVTLKGVQHSQGGHTFFSNALVLDLSKLANIKQINDTLIRVQTGASWKDVLDFLHPLGLSVAVMQSDYDFSVGGTLSTNVHGWQAKQKPMINSIEGFHILLANGQYLYCSRQENTELFKAAIGGYGLLGIIIDVDLKVVSNKNYHLRQWIITPLEFKDFFLNHVQNNPKATLFFGRFSCDSKNFLEKMIFNIYEDIGQVSSLKKLSNHSWAEKGINYFFGLTYKSDFFKRVRWFIESNFVFRRFYTDLSRNELFYHSVHNYLTSKENETDLLQEFFIPLEHFHEFVHFLQSLKGELIDSLMNITVRHVLKEEESFLNYASQDMIGFVMYFRGPKNSTFDQLIKNIALKITDQTLAFGGSYYLPYRPYQTPAQFQKSYPRYQDFQNIKLKYDPHKIFINQFYKNYFE